MREKLGGWSPIDVVDDVGGDGVVHGLVLAQVLGADVVEVFNLGHAFQVTRTVKPEMRMLWRYGASWSGICAKLDELG